MDAFSVLCVRLLCLSVGIHWPVRSDRAVLAVFPGHSELLLVWRWLGVLSRALSGRAVPSQIPAHQRRHENMRRLGAHDPPAGDTSTPRTLCLLLLFCLVSFPQLPLDLRSTGRRDSRQCCCPSRWTRKCVRMHTHDQALKQRSRTQLFLKFFFKNYSFFYFYFYFDWMMS